MLPAGNAFEFLPLMGIFNKPPLRPGRRKDDMPEGLWTKCPECGAMLHTLELKQNLGVCHDCEHHFLMTAPDRIELLADPGTFTETEADMESANPLGFEKYADKLAALKDKSGLSEAVVTGRLEIGGKPSVIAAMDFRFFAGSMGSVVGEKITRAVELAIAERRAVVVISASSGARMQEGMFSLMQMAKTCAALGRLSEASLPFISVMTHPTTGGVTASFATIGDINIAEPGCMIGFAGPRVIKETTHQNLPPGFQTAEFMLEHGLIDAIVARRDMRAKLIQLIGYLMPG